MGAAVLAADSPEVFLEGTIRPAAPLRRAAALTAARVQAAAAVAAAKKSRIRSK